VLVEIETALHLGPKAYKYAIVKLREGFFFSLDSGGMPNWLIRGLDEDPTGESLTSVEMHMREGLQFYGPRQGVGSTRDLNMYQAVLSRIWRNSGRICVHLKIFSGLSLIIGSKITHLKTPDVGKQN